MGFTFLLIVFLEILHCNGKGPFVPCQVSWVPDGNGHVQEESLQCSPGVNQYIARVYFDGKWNIGNIFVFMSKIGY